jgi:hypothetical protein
MVTTVTIKVGDPRFANTTPGMIKQVQDYLRRETVAEIRKVQQRQRGEDIVYRIDNRFDRPIIQSKWKIQAFWQLPGPGEILRKVWQLKDAETYKHVTRRTGRLGSSWRVFYKRPAPGPGRNPNVAQQVSPSFPNSVPPGSTYTFINVAPYGSLMSRYSAIIALRGSIAKSVARTKPDKEARISGRVTQLTRSIFYQNTPRGYSTVVRIRKAVTRGPKLVTIRAFDLEPTGNLGNLKRISGIAVTFWRRLRSSDVAKQGRAR